MQELNLQHKSIEWQEEGFEPGNSGLQSQRANNKVMLLPKQANINYVKKIKVK